MESLKIKKRLDRNGNYKIPNDIIFRDCVDVLLLKYNLELNIGDDMKLISAILIYISNKHYKFLSIRKLEIYFHLNNLLYINANGLTASLFIYNIDDFYLIDNILYRFENSEELKLVKRRLKIGKILNNKKNTLPL